MSQIRTQQPPEPTGQFSQQPSSLKYPLVLDPRCRPTGLGSHRLYWVTTEDLETNEEEKKSVLEVVELLLQAREALDSPGPEPLDHGDNIKWDWRSLCLTDNAYGKLIYVILEHMESPQNLCYDVIPDESNSVTINIRKKCSFQRSFMWNLVEYVDNGFYDYKLNDCVKFGPGFGLQPQTRASVLVGDKLGMRTPCRCFQFGKRDEADEDVQDFVLEIAMADKSKVLPELARSYIERGTLCVMTVDIRRRGECRIFLAYSLYHRGEVKGMLAGTTRYEVIESIRDVVPEDEPGGSLMLRLQDFFPADVLKERVTGPQNSLPSITISHKAIVACLPKVFPDIEEKKDLYWHIKDPTAKRRWSLSTDLQDNALKAPRNGHFRSTKRKKT
ncbi:MAG: hypothetical protein Q9184_001214 [Pyrenodesmia sp. 2 TL-2023]